MRVKFFALWVGDRFIYPATYQESGEPQRLWTVIDSGTARVHSPESLRLKGAGYGYMADNCMSFDQDADVWFVAPTGEPK